MSIYTIPEGTNNSIVNLEVNLIFSIILYKSCDVVDVIDQCSICTDYFASNNILKCYPLRLICQLAHFALCPCCYFSAKLPWELKPKASMGALNLNFHDLCRRCFSSEREHSV